MDPGDKRRDDTDTSVGVSTLDDARLSNPKDRFKHSDLLYAKLAEITPERTTPEWLALCREHGVPAMRVNHLDDLFGDPHLKAIDFFQTRQHPTEGAYVEVQPPVRFSARADAAVGMAPQLGQHNEEVLRELGLPARED
jgi:crotonobetainyl-CoA:carnitine CoA-transferase CaiB-like acyl-CoA transferase